MFYMIKTHSIISHHILHFFIQPNDGADESYVRTYYLENVINQNNVL